MKKKNSSRKTPYLPVGLIIFGLIILWKYWLNILMFFLVIFLYIWNFITPTTYTLFLYRDNTAIKGTDLPNQQVYGYKSLQECQEKGVEFTEKGYAKFSCGERCKNPAIGESDCTKAYY